uniref:And ankyrin domain protein n=1 Tax=Colletotrichum fructicola (strain Nara gc5) TaxID=1213859 RepID=L2FSN8_COLFN
MVACEAVGESKHPDAVAAAKFLDVVRRDLFEHRQEAFERVRGLIGRKRGHVDVTEDLLIQLASAPGWEPMAFVLDTQSKPKTITDNVVAAAVENKSRYSRSIVKVLLDGREDQITITEKCLIAAMSPRPYDGLDHRDTIELLLNNKAIRVSPTEKFLIERVGADDLEILETYWLMTRLLDKRKGDQITITENVLVVAAAAASKSQYLNHMMSLLLERKKNQITITEDVLIAVAANEKNGAFTMLTIQREMGYLTVTEKVLAAAATNKELRSSILGDLFSRESNQRPVTNQVLKTVYQNLSDTEGRTALQLEMNKRGIC